MQSKYASAELATVVSGLAEIPREELLLGEAKRMGKDKALLFEYPSEDYNLTIAGDVMTLDGVVYTGLFRRVRSLMEEQDEDAELRLEINSPGGDATEGVAVLNYLLQDGRVKETRVLGEAFSAASYIFLAGETRTMSTGASLGIHDAWGIAIGDATHMNMRARMLDTLSENIATVYAKFCGGEKEEWRDRMKQTTLFTPDEALEAGFCTEALDTAGTVAKKEKNEAAEDRPVAAKENLAADLVAARLASSLI